MNYKMRVTPAQAGDQLKGAWIHAPVRWGRLCAGMTIGYHPEFVRIFFYGISGTQY